MGKGSIGVNEKIMGEVEFGEDEVGEEESGNLIVILEREDAEDLDVANTGEDEWVLAITLIDFIHKRVELKGNIFRWRSIKRLTVGAVLDGQFIISKALVMVDASGGKFVQGKESFVSDGFRVVGPIKSDVIQSGVVVIDLFT